MYYQDSSAGRLGIQSSCALTAHLITGIFSFVRNTDLYKEYKEITHSSYMNMAYILIYWLGVCCKKYWL